MSIWENISLALPEIFLVVVAMVLLLAGVFAGEKHTRTIGWMAVSGLVAALFMVQTGAGAKAQPFFNGAFVVDDFSNLCKGILYLGASLAILISTSFMERERIARFEYPILILFATIGMSLMVSASDLISLYMAIELQSLTLYILAAFNRDSRRSTEAGLKYFVLGALSSGLLLYGASLIYGFTGATTFDEIAKAAQQSEYSIGLVFGLVFLICGLAFKVSAAPFHMWTPDVYEGAPTPVTAFFAAVPKFAGMAVIARVMIEAFPYIIDQWQPVLILISIASMAVGAFSAIRQTNIKRLMAYSSIGHMGYALMGVIAGTVAGVEALLVYMTIYMVMSFGIFACILMMQRTEGMTESISDLAGISQTRPVLAMMFTILLFSLAGIPPLIGFFAKFFVFKAAIEAGLIYLAVIGAVMSAISAFYYLNIIRHIWFSAPTQKFIARNDKAVSITANSAGLAMVLGVFALIAPLISVVERAALALF